MITDFRYWDPSRFEKLFDAKTGEFIRPIEDFRTFLRDGRLLKVIHDGDEAQAMVVEQPTGDGGVTIDLPDVGYLETVWKGSTGHLLLAHSPGRDEMGYLSYRVESLNIENGEMRRVGDGLRPERELLFWKDGRTLVRWDPDRVELVPVVVGAGGR